MITHTPNWLALIVFCSALILLYLGSALLVFTKTKRLGRLVATVVGLAGFILCLSFTSNLFIYAYLIHKADQIRSKPLNRSQVRSLLKSFSESRIPPDPHIVANLHIKDSTGISMYRYSFFSFLNKDNCIDVLYGKDGKILAMIEVFE